MNGVYIEIKAKYDSLEKARKILKNIGASFSMKSNQCDTYYNVPKGRLKVRQSSEALDIVVFYDREDICGPKRNNIRFFETEDAGQIKGILDGALEAKIIVKKARELWRLDNIRIHLDNVVGLGTFIEFEIITKTEKDIDKSRARAEELISTFGIKKEDLIDKSYSDMLLSDFHGPKDDAAKSV